MPNSFLTWMAVNIFVLIPQEKKMKVIYNLLICFPKYKQNSQTLFLEDLFSWCSRNTDILENI